VQDRYAENYKTMKGIKEDLSKWRDNMGFMDYQTQHPKNK